jgi:hypothetical protein
MAATAATSQPGDSAPADSAAKPTLVYPHLTLPGGAWAQVYSDGLAEVFRPGAAGAAASTAVEHVPLFNPDGGTSPTGDGVLELPAKGQLMADLAEGPSQLYVADQVVVIYKSGIGSAAVSKAQAGLGVDQTKPLFAGATRQRLAALRNSAQASTGRALLDFPDAQVLHVTKASVADAVEKLRANPNVAFAEPNWTVTPTDTPPIQVPAAAMQQAKASPLAVAAGGSAAAAASSPAATTTALGVPDNFALTSSAQSMLNKPGDDIVPAYADIAKQFGQLPGQGEIITNVSLGTLDDASALTNPTDKCFSDASIFGPTTEVIDGQRYIDWPSMPLIPTYTASSSGVLDPTGETCGDDLQLTEVGLDFSMMAPLPHDQQRAGAVGSGLTDLLGIAPGASYRLVVPGTPGGAVTDVDAALLAASSQTPRPNVITISLGFGLDADGLPDRYLEDDAMTESVIASIVSSGIVVSVSAGDGLRTGQVDAAVAPSGGAAATNVTANPDQVTSLDDIDNSTAPSVDLDSGSMDVGGSTLDDITAAPPDNPANKATAYLQSYPATRYTGGRLYASGFGSRVNVSAPGDNVLSFDHPVGGAADAVSVVNEGGTSASAPQAAAAAAIVQQVARLTGNTNLASSPQAIRGFLASTGTALPAVPQSDTPLNVGPQIDIGRAVEQLLTAAGQPAAVGVARVAVAQRQQHSALAGSITTTTDPSNISLTGRLSNAWITIAPDWTGLPANGVAYQLASAADGTGHSSTLASTPWARLQPTAILAAAGLPLVSASSQNVPLVYTASEHGRVVATATFTLTFDATDGTVPDVQAPLVPPVVTGKVIPVHYDLSRLKGDTSPTLVVSEPGRVDPSTGLFFRPAFTAALTALSGTINVPVSALPGGGIYGIGIQQGPGDILSTNYSTFAFTHVAPTGTVAPAVPTLSVGSAPAGHFAEVGFNGPFQLHYDVRKVPGATGAIAEFSAAGPNAFNSFETFNNPAGSERDNNGVDTGSVAFVPLQGVHGAATLNAGTLGLAPTLDNDVRVFATDHGEIVGEASGSSLVGMDGIAAADGGSVADGFGVNANGTDGLLTSNQVTASGTELGSIEAFDQNTGATKTVVSSSDEYATLAGGCAGIYGNDTGVVDDFNGATDTYQTLSPVSGGAITGQWSPPADVGSILCAAENQTSDQTVLVNGLNGQLFVTPVDFAAGTTGTPINISNAVPALLIGGVGSVAYNPATGHAYVGAAFVPGATVGTIADVDTNTGQVSSLSTAANSASFIDGMAIDPVTNKALVGGLGNGFSIVDLATGTSTFAEPGGSDYRFPVWIPGTTDFMIVEFTSPDFHGDPSGVFPSNNNTMTSVLVVDENGNVLHRYEQFNYGPGFFLDDGEYLQPGSANGFTVGFGATQLYPFAFQKQ